MNRIFRGNLTRRQISVGVLIMLIVAGFAYATVGWYVRSHAQQATDRARKLLLVGKPALARSALDWLLTFDSDHSEAMFLLGACRQAEGDVTGAIESLSRVPEESAVHEEASEALGRLLISEGRLEQAEWVLTRHLRRYPRAKNVRHRLWWLYFKQYRPRAIVSLLEERLTLFPDDLSVLVALLETEYDATLPNRYVGYLEEIKQKRAGQAPVLLALGYCHWRLGEIEAATHELNSALALRPDHVPTQIVVAQFLLEIGETDAADSILNRGQSGDRVKTGADGSPLVRKLENDDRFWLMQGMIAERRGQTQRALEFLNRAISLRPQEVEYYNRRANLLRRTGQTQQAQETAERAVELERNRRTLFDLSIEFRSRDPTPEECRWVATQCAAFGMPVQAQAWKRAAERISSSGRTQLEPRKRSVD
jgi:tetratricopeptide (TPR) repeat protein